MKRVEASKLLERYLLACQEGKEPYFDAGEIDDLLESFEESDDFTYYNDVLALGLRLHPGSFDLKIRQCRFFLINNEPQKALEQVDFLAKTNNEDIDLIKLECYCRLKKYKVVLEILEKLVSANCDYLEAIFEHLAGILNDLEMEAEARDWIDRGLLLYPDNIILKEELTYILEANGDLEEAIKICNQLIEKNPFSFDTWFMLGRLYSMTANYKKAIESYDFALACDDSEVEVKLLKSYCLFMDGQYEEALQSYYEVSEDINLKERLIPMISDCLIKLGRFSECYVLLQEMVYDKTNKYLPNVYINYIYSCMENDCPDEAVTIMNRTLELYPDDLRLLSLLSLTYLEHGREKDAIAVASRILEQISFDEDEIDEEYKYIFNSSLKLCFNGNLSKAYRFYKRLFELKPNIPFLNIHKAMAYFNLGDMELFEKYYKKTSHKQLDDYMDMFGVDEIEIEYVSKHIQPEDLAREFLNNKDNNN